MINKCQLMSTGGFIHRDKGMLRNESSLDDSQAGKGSQRRQAT